MTLSLPKKASSEIDGEFWKIYKNKLGGSELTQLAKLFRHGGLPKRLENILSPLLPSPSAYYREELEVSIAWIDKRPLAKLKTHSGRVELGDAAFFFFDILQHKKTIYRQARAVILQAKIAREKGQIVRPTVPVNPGKPKPTSSTAHELELLSAWKSFDLYATSGSRTAIVRDISVAPVTSPPANGWFMATPKIQPGKAASSTWISPWMCGPASAGTVCNLTIGNLIYALLTSSIPTAGAYPFPEVGADFSFDPKYLLSPHGNNWDRLCIELLRLCPKNKLPPSVFGKTTKGAVITSTVRSVPYLGSRGAFTNWFSRTRNSLRRRRMPILIIAIIRKEGESAAKSLGAK